MLITSESRNLTMLWEAIDYWDILSGSGHFSCFFLLWDVLGPPSSRCHLVNRHVLAIFISHHQINFKIYMVCNYGNTGGDLWQIITYCSCNHLGRHGVKSSKMHGWDLLPGPFSESKSEYSRQNSIRVKSAYQGWAGKAFWLTGTGREIENHIFVLREGNGN